MDDLKGAIEALLFASEKPLSAEELKSAFSVGGEDGVSVSDIRKQVDALKNEYEEQNRGFRVYEIANGFQPVASLPAPGG